MSSHALLGAIPQKGGVHFAVWAPQAKTVDVLLEEKTVAPFSLQKSSHGLFEGMSLEAHIGSLYRYRIDGQGAYPDPASRFQPHGVHGPSEVVDPSTFKWTDQGWKGVALKDLILYELHVGTFTTKGTYTGLLERLPYLADLGITALELMPLADFSGSRNWGYDGVSLFAPSHSYGRPDELCQLVDKAHALGLGVFLDVVYNHLGPDGNYLGSFSPFYFTDKHKTPWGSAVNLDSERSDQARDFFIQNALHWIHDYHIDGLRLDATHAMMDDSPRHFLAELTDRVRSSAPQREVILIAEDCRNLSHMIKPEKEKGWGLDAVWSDDFHHHIRRSLAGDHESYFQDFSGSLEDIAATIRQGWFFQGQHSAHFKGPRGTDSKGIALDRFVFFTQNHDQVGNRAFGERLNTQIDLPSYRAVSTLLLTVPETPLLFMGQEWATDTPFLYFTDHHEELGKLVTEGRRKEFKSFSAFTHEKSRDRIPDPQALSTFHQSRLDWSELNHPPHTHVAQLYKRLLQWRKNNLVPLEGAQDFFTVKALTPNVLSLDYRKDRQPQFWIMIQWQGSGTLETKNPEGALWEKVLSTEDPEVCADPKPVGMKISDLQAVFEFQRPGALILKKK
jgi:maltooligosyltrehalose trehalohydrolase